MRVALSVRNFGVGRSDSDGCGSGPRMWQSRSVGVATTNEWSKTYRFGPDVEVAGEGDEHGMSSVRTAVEQHTCY